MIDVSMGGRAAEEIFLGTEEISSGLEFNLNNSQVAVMI